MCASTAVLASKTLRTAKQRWIYCRCWNLYVHTSGMIYPTSCSLTWLLFTFQRRDGSEIARGISSISMSMKKEIARGISSMTGCRIGCDDVQLQLPWNECFLTELVLGWTPCNAAEKNHRFCWRKFGPQIWGGCTCAIVQTFPAVQQGTDCLAFFNC